MSAAPKKPAPLHFPDEVLPAAAVKDDGSVVMRPRIYLSPKEVEKLFNWSGRALNWMKHKERQKLAKGRAKK